MGMGAAQQLTPMSVEEYLARELDSSVKHEYLGGFVYAQAGANNAHNLIASNVLGALHGRLRGSRCRAYNSDTKVRVKLPTHVRFYYPDVAVICESNPGDDSFQDRPTIIFEVLSQKTRRIDEGEKKDAYLTIPTLFAYVLIDQDHSRVTVYRRSDQGFSAEVYTSLDEAILFSEIETELPLAEIYEAVEFASEPEED
jgi:Uma2 family endonuclease